MQNKIILFTNNIIYISSIQELEGIKTGKKFVLTFAGDTSLGEWYIREQGNKNLLKRLEENPFSFFEGVKPLIDNSDCLILNLETVISDNPNKSLEGKQYPNWDHPARILNVLCELGVTAAGLANNHSMDFGPEVMLSTIDKLKGVQIEAFGAGNDIDEASRPFKLELKGEYSKKSVYIFSGMSIGRRYRERYNFFANKEKQGINPLSKKAINNKISNFRKKDPGAIIIVYPHWQGLDYKWASENLKVQEKCRGYIEAGADCVFGHGPHMVNEIEKYQNGIIAYSIGNFVFNSPGRYQTFGVPPFSLVVKLEVTENYGDWSMTPYFYPIVTDNKSTGYKVGAVNDKQTGDLKRTLSDRANVSNIKAAYEVGNNKTGFYLTVKN